MDARMTDTTRRLCAAAHLSQGFSQKVLAETLGEEYKAAAPCYGLDIATVAKHALAAEKRRATRDALLASALLLGSLLAVNLVIILWPSTEAISLTPRSGGALRAARIGIGSSLLFMIIAAVSIEFREKWQTIRMVARNLSKWHYNPDCVAEPRNERTRKKLDDVKQKQECGITIYSGFSPFVGSGIDIGGWSLTLDVTRAKQPLTDSDDSRMDGEKYADAPSPKPFSVPELYAEMDSKLHALGIGTLSTEDRLFINGRDVKDDLACILDTHGRISSSTRYGGASRIDTEPPSQRGRHYKCIRITDWRGELVFSFYLTLSLEGKNLFVDASYFLLTPLAGYHRVCDHMIPVWYRVLIPSMLTGPVRMATLPAVYIMKAAGLIFAPLGRWMVGNAAKKDPDYDYGTITSLRESESSLAYERYFQRIDVDMHVKVLEKQVLDSIIDYADSKGVDTSEFRQQQATIINSGIIISGGSITAESMAVGRNSGAVVDRAQDVMRRAKGRRLGRRKKPALAGSNEQ